ncbi:ribonuclease III [Bremerella cremea]|uniref:Ribonuclease 3 n=2 Tax=Bremerella cremea TaxID=1031537 RepID=A0A368KWT1_9BACT|nr:ribonuclease III [Bremerella cremea]
MLRSQDSLDSSEDQLSECEQKLGYTFQNRALLQSALTHASGASHRLGSNERLEFLGDAILGKYVCETLFHKFPNYLEGDLTRIKSIVVSRSTCARLSDAMGLEPFLILGKGMASSQSVPRSLLADVFEAIIAAIYLDGGNEKVNGFLDVVLAEEIEQASAGEVGSNYKSMLQQYAQREFGTTPNYELVAEKGPDHSKIFNVAVQLQGNRYTSAWGSNKKEAEQRAAKNALHEIEGEEPPFLENVATEEIEAEE